MFLYIEYIYLGSTAALSKFTRSRLLQTQTSLRSCRISPIATNCTPIILEYTGKTVVIARSRFLANRRQTTGAKTT